MSITSLNQLLTTLDSFIANNTQYHVDIHLRQQSINERKRRTCGRCKSCVTTEILFAIPLELHSFIPERCDHGFHFSKFFIYVYCIVALSLSSYHCDYKNISVLYKLFIVHSYLDNSTFR